MIRRSYMVICAKGPFTCLEASRAYQYAADNHGYVVKMYGEDDAVEDAKEVTPATNDDRPIELEHHPV